MSGQRSIYKEMRVGEESQIPTMYQSLISSLIGEAVISARRTLGKGSLSRVERYKLGV